MHTQRRRRAEGGSVLGILLLLTLRSAHSAQEKGGRGLSPRPLLLLTLRSAHSAQEKSGRGLSPRHFVIADTQKCTLSTGEGWKGCHHFVSSALKAGNVGP